MLKAGDKAPDFEVLDHDGQEGLAQEPEGKALRALVLSEGRHAGLHEGRLRFPRQDPRLPEEGRRDPRRLVRQAGGQQGVRREVQVPLPAPERHRAEGRRWRSARPTTRARARRSAYTFVVGPDGKIEQAIDTKDPAGQADALLRRCNESEAVRREKKTPGRGREVAARGVSLASARQLTRPSSRAAS